MARRGVVSKLGDTTNPWAASASVAVLNSRAYSAGTTRKGNFENRTPINLMGRVNFWYSDASSSNSK